MILINLLDSAFANMLTPAVESYVVPTADEYAIAQEPVETAGSLFGRNIGTNSDVHLEISYASAYVSADCQPTHCARSHQSQALHRTVHTTVFPSTEYLGDFHSHPYHAGELADDGTATSSSLISKKGLYRFSGSPENRSDGDYAATYHRPGHGDGTLRVGVVLTLFREKRTTTFFPPRHLDNYSGIEFPFYAGKHFGKDLRFHCWLKAYVFYPHNYHPVDDAAVNLYCPALGKSPNLVC